MEDPIKAFLERGGTVTRCPTVYLLPIPGAEPNRSGVSDRVMLDDLPLRDKKRIAKDVFMAKLRAKKAAKGPSASELQALAEHRELMTQKRLQADAEIKAMFERGESIPEIARLKGRSTKVIRQCLRRAGVTELPRTQVKSGPASLLAPEIHKLHSQGMGRNEIARTLGCKEGTVRHHLKRAGIVLDVRVLSPKATAKIVALYNEGYGSITIARMVGRSKTCVLETLKREGVTLRERGKNGRAEDAA